MAGVYGIVKNHDVWISLKSKVDQGTSVRIYLPAAIRKSIEPQFTRKEKS